MLSFQKNYEFRFFKTTYVDEDNPDKILKTQSKLQRRILGDTNEWDWEDVPTVERTRKIEKKDLKYYV